MRTHGNLFADIATVTTDQLEDLLAAPGVRIERIVMTAQATSPSDVWYDEPVTEWIVVLAGAAELLFEDEPTPRRLQPGDYVLIMPHQRHRVTWLTPDGPTVWLAVHISN
jgi:cupin 2 domain-containing protein